MKNFGEKSNFRTKGIIKLIVSVIILVIVLLGIKLKFDDPFISGVKGWISLVLLIGAFVSIVRSSAEITSSGKGETKSDAETATPEIGSILSPKKGTGKIKSQLRIIPANSAVALLAEWDIIEFEAVVGERKLIFGSSSDCEAGSSVSFDKLYYIENEKYAELGEMVEALNSWFPMGEIPLIHIDGVDPKHYKIPRTGDK